VIDDEVIVKESQEWQIDFFVEFGQLCVEIA
jgi:hypothetical protein